MSRSRKFLLVLPLLAALGALAAQGQDPAQDPATGDVLARIRMAELQYMDQSGTLHAIPANTIMQVRLLADEPEGMALEIYYENGDYSLIRPQALHIIRKGQGAQEVQLIRTTRKRMQFPAIP